MSEMAHEQTEVRDDTREFAMGRRAVKHAAAGAAAVIGAGALSLFGAGPAGATPATLTWNDGQTQFTRTISNGTPAVGDTITVTTAMYRTKTPDVTYLTFKDYHPSCLTYVVNSAKLTDAAGTHPIEPWLEVKPDFIAADFISEGLNVVSKAGATGAQAPVFSAQYKVGDCAAGTSLTTGIAYSQAGAGGAWDGDSKVGPSITVGGTPGGGTGSSGSSNLPAPLNTLMSLLGGTGSSK
ncbi:hypothetical protein [Nocardia tengchongensis]|uniref:hypothetical protein n=1 Tax=Nocardia tengchongensis TaxID=2055889 RepID=UPI00369F5982